MADILRETHTVERGNTNDTVARREVSSVSVIARVIYFIAGVVSGLLFLRFVLALLGANPSNPFADFIYTVSQPFVAPFAGLFNYKTQFGVSRFELESLIAIAVYALLAWGLVKFIAVVTNTRDDEIET